MEWFLSLQFLSGLIIGAAFGLVGGLLIGLVVGAPVASEIMAAEGSQQPSSTWEPATAGFQRPRGMVDRAREEEVPVPVARARQKFGPVAPGPPIDMTPPPAEPAGAPPEAARPAGETGFPGAPQPGPAEGAGRPGGEQPRP